MRLLGVGHTANVYEFEENKVLKLFHKGYALDGVFGEYRNGLLVENMKFSHPRLYGMLRFEGKNGLVYDKVNGETLLEEILSQKREFADSANLMATLHTSILSNQSTATMDYRDFLSNLIHFGCGDNSEKEIWLNKVRKLPDGDRLCHGDFHPGNIMIDADGTPVIIDMMNVCHGPSAYDIARTYYLTAMSPLTDELPDKDRLNQYRETLAKAYLCYMHTNLDDIKEYLEIIVEARKGE